MGKRWIAFLCIIVLFLLTACIREQTVPSAPADINAVSDSDAGDVVSLEDEQELEALSQSLEEDDLDLAGLDELVGVE